MWPEAARASLGDRRGGTSGGPGAYAWALAAPTESSLLAGLDDPFDRMIVAAARATGRPLISADERVQDGDLVAVIWD